MDTVELFAGIGGFRLASERCGAMTVWANDCCPKACSVYRSRFGEGTIREGDINGFLDEVPPHDLLTAGFPCQPFSSAGKKRGIKDPRGTLFSVVVDVLRRHQPRFFILENVKRLLTMERGVHFATILAALAELDYQIEWRLLNASDFGLPQNRQRVFIVGVRGNENRHPSCGAFQDQRLRLAVADDFAKVYLDRALFWDHDRWTDIASHGSRFPDWGLARSGKFLGSSLDRFTAQREPVKLRSVMQDDVPDEFDFTDSTLERLGASKCVKRFIGGVEILSNQGGGARMGYTVFGVNGIAPTLTSAASRHYERYCVGKRFRRLTNVEYARIQGFPDDHCSAVSVYDQYALFGNAVPPPIAEWVMRQLVSGGTSAHELPRRTSQRRLFADA
jgi:DNA (cytosine-5)-methyltransferase 1